MSKIFRAFVENKTAIERYLKRFSRNAEDVEDFLQETFLKGFAAERQREIKQHKAFLFQIAKHTALAELRRRDKKPSSQLEDFKGFELLLVDDAVGPDDWHDSRRKLALLTKAVAELPPQCQKAFLLRRIDGLQYKQIANRMGISVSAVEKHVAAGLLKCYAYLRNYGYEASEFGAGAIAQKSSSEPDERKDESKPQQSCSPKDQRGH
ncbi:MAG: RNA polymerase sigma factor [Pseudomonadota bacterium]